MDVFVSLLLASTFFDCSSATYQLVQDYSGDAFFQGFDFFTEPDPTQGHVQFKSMAEANATGIAGLMDGGNATRAVYMGVDTTDEAPNGRGSVRVTSSQTFQHGLFIADIVHMPGGICGTWPAFWMVGADWPKNGEIDIAEGVNDQASNQMTLHTSAGPIIQNDTSYTGTLLTTNCDVNAKNQDQNAGCGIADESGLTFGSSFNENGGGIFATEWTSQFIKIWFFPRGEFPADISGGQPSPSESWGAPNSVFQGDFDIDDHFRDMQLVFDTTFCGSWAGQVWSSSSCASLAPTCEEYVTKNPAAFKEAYWAINTLHVFQDNGQAGQPNNGTVVTKAVAAAAAAAAEQAQVSQGKGERKMSKRNRTGGAVLPITKDNS